MTTTQGPSEAAQHRQTTQWQKEQVGLFDLANPVRSPYTLPEYQDAIWKAVTQDALRFEQEDTSARVVELVEERPEYFADIHLDDDHVTAQQIIAKLRARKAEDARKRRKQNMGATAEETTGPTMGW